KLTVAADCSKDPAWNRFRKLRPVVGLGDRAMVLVPIEAEGHPWSSKYRGPIRFESAELIRDLIVRLYESGCPEILVVTPFRAQRTLIRQKLPRVPVPVRVSTAHRAQGGECHTVIFDPAYADNEFLKTDDAERLVNVALSRAQARLVLILSKRDRLNPIFRSIATVVENLGNGDSGRPIQEFLDDPDFPDCVLGEIVRSGTITGRVIRILEGGRKLTVECFSTGARRVLSVDYLRGTGNQKGR
ncbi:MAG: AAA domain-containing protein, partial [Candidatus Eisenbacteria bacterium]